MDTLNQIFAATNTYIHPIGIIIIAMVAVIGTWFVRAIVETLAKDYLRKDDGSYPSRLSRWWFRVVLPVLPVLFASLMSAIPSESFFGKKLLADAVARFFFCLVIGWFSTTIYRIVKYLVKLRTGIEMPSGPPSLETYTSQPPPDPEIPVTVDLEPPADGKPPTT